MKHYLDLIPISAKQHRKQNRMTRLCIVLAVFLVTVIFGMADMEIRSQMIQAVRTDGSWHACFVVGEEIGELLKERPEIKHTACYGVLNYYLKDGYQIEGTETAICGLEQEFLEMVPAAEIVEGVFPKDKAEAVLNESARVRLNVKIGDTIEMTIPQGDARRYRITGITQDTSLEAEHDAFGMILNMDGFHALYPKETEAAQEELYYVQFQKFCNIQKAIGEITAQFGLEQGQVRQNAKVLALMFQTRDSYMMNFYYVAAVLAVLVIFAGVFMITASMNSHIVRRTEFFGMMRCLGATRKQVIRFVRREALSWCKTAVPAGTLAGIFVVWGLCGMLRYLSPSLFEGMPVFGISFPGIFAGIIVGVLTVLLAARAPARRAAKVSPLAAVSGNAGTVQAARGAAHTRLFKVDMALGFHHASGSKKNFFLVTGSFAFSIILFLTFSTAIDFMHHALNPLRPSSPDVLVYREDRSNGIPKGLAGEIAGYPGVKCAFGRSYAEFTVSPDAGKVILLSYDERQFQWAGKSLLEGNLQDAKDGKGVLSAYQGGRAAKAGSSIALSAGGEEREVPVAGVLGDVPFSYGADESGREIRLLICSEELFRQLTGQMDYAVLDVQLRRDATDAQVREIRKAMEQACGGSVSFSDKRIQNREVKGAGYSMAVFLYGFLAVIALIAFFNIVNCIAMSVSARMREYGAMRAIGMSVRQLTRMVVGETMTYTVFGVIFGCAAGLPLNRLLFGMLVTSRWGTQWSFPGAELLVIAAVMLASVCMAAAGPARQIRGMTVVDTIATE